MALFVQTQSPRNLLANIRKGIDEGHIKTWEYTSRGDFTHSPPQWRNKAWLRPEIKASGLAFNIIRPQNAHISSEVYAVYHGRYIEMLLAHFELEFTEALATALPRESDLV